MMPHPIRSVIPFLALSLFVACDSDATIPDEGDPSREGVLATFDVSGETFHLWTTDEETIEQLFSLEAGTSEASIPNGVLRSGPGEGDHNEPWSWHLDPEEVSMAEVTAEFCDGRPSFVEANLDQWLNDVGRYCPWNAELVELQDLRP